MSRWCVVRGEHRTSVMHHNSGTALACACWCLWMQMQKLSDFYFSASFSALSLHFLCTFSLQLGLVINHHYLILEDTAFSLETTPSYACKITFTDICFITICIINPDFNHSSIIIITIIYI